MLRFLLLRFLPRRLLPVMLLIEGYRLVQRLRRRDPGRSAQAVPSDVTPTGPARRRS